MINKKDFIPRYLNILKKLLEELLPEEDTLLDMCDKADKITYDNLKKD